MNISALNTGINGINQGLGNMRRDASAIAQAVNNSMGDNAATQPTEVTSALVNLKLDTLQIQASTKVVETVNEIIGSLLDVTA
ncbi:MAG TPA: hypothetical protein ENK04_15380 [Gammaproteobacteria bacterium]|nr:hypothetical protein [Gammaproteobacteria bacterium]